jgi:hypothetical protein
MRLPAAGKSFFYSPATLANYSCVQYQRIMPMHVVEAMHVRVVCDACGINAELCSKRELALGARARATRIFQTHGWHHDAGERSRVRAQETAEREGIGRWYCPRCSRQTHL